MSGRIKVSSEGLNYASRVVVLLESGSRNEPVIDTTITTPDMMWLWRGPWLRLV